MPLPKLSIAEKAYIAGIIDGEGTISITYDGRNKRNLSIRVMVSNTNEELLKWLKNKIGGFYRINSEPSKEGWKRYGCWSIAHSKAIELLEQIRNYLVIKKDQYLIAIPLQATKKEALSERKEKIIELQQQFPPMRDGKGRIIKMNFKNPGIDQGWIEAFYYLKQEMHKANKKGANYAHS